MSDRRCAICGKSMRHAVRVDAVYCGDRCRQRAWRIRQRDLAIRGQREVFGETQLVQRRLDEQQEELADVYDRAVIVLHERLREVR